MSALDSGQSTLGIVWVHNGDAETKGGVIWGAGNDSTGVGTPLAPYLTHLQALKEIRTDEGQKDITKSWEIRLLTDDGEVTDYGDTTFADSATLPDTPNPYFILLSGWLKVFGAVNRGKWASIAERPLHGRIAKTSIGNLGGGLVRWVLKDIQFTSTAAILVEIFLDGSSLSGVPDALGKAFGCTFDWTTSVGTANRVFRYQGDTNTNRKNQGFVGCFFRRKILMSTAINDSTPNAGVAECVNCTFITRLQEDCLQGLEKRRWHLLNCIVSPDGAGAFAIINSGAGNTLSNTMVRYHNRFHMRGGSSFFRQVTNGTLDIAAFAKLGGFDDESSGGDPLLTSISNPTVTDASPSLDKGGLHAIFFDDAFDTSGNNFHEVDILGYLWGDSIDFNTPTTADGDSKYSHRAIGCHQNLLGVVPPAQAIDWPIGTTPSPTIYIASAVPKDPDLLGTLQFRVLQATDAAMTSNLIIKDSCPITVDATNNKINFDEDGAGGFTATLASGIYDTQELMAEIKAKMEAAGAGTYTVTYNSSTGITTIAVAGAVSTVQIFWFSGADAANSVRSLTGHNGTDSADAASIVGQDFILENFFDPALTYEFSETRTPESNPATDGAPWVALGTGLPKDGGAEGTDGVSGDPADDRDVRVDLGTTDPFDEVHYHAIQFRNGKNKSQDVEV